MSSFALQCQPARPLLRGRGRAWRRSPRGRRQAPHRVAAQLSSMGRVS